MVFLIDRLFGRRGYSLKLTIKVHKAPVNALAFSSKGSVLATGGDDGEVHLFDVKTMNEFQVIKGTWGQITCLSFCETDRTAGPPEFLLIGTGKGKVLGYRCGHTTPSYIPVFDISVSGMGDSLECIAFDSLNSCLGISTHWGTIAVYDFDADSVKLRWKSSTEPHLPRAVSFSEDGNCLNVFTMDDGVICNRDAATFRTMMSKELETAIGSVATYTWDEMDQVLIDNMRDGFDLFGLNDKIEFIRHFPVPNGERYVRSSSFGEAGRVVVCGSHRGKAFVYDKEGGELLQVLKHAGSSGMIQTLAACRFGDEYLIATGAANGKYDVKVWSKKIQSPRRKTKKTGFGGYQILLNVIFIGLLAYLASDSWLPTMVQRLEEMNFPARQSEGILAKFPELLRRSTHTEQRDFAYVKDAIDRNNLKKFVGKDVRWALSREKVVDEEAYGEAARLYRRLVDREFANEKSKEQEKERKRVAGKPEMEKEGELVSGRLIDNLLGAAV